MDKHWKRCVLRAWNDQYESPCGNEEDRTHRLTALQGTRILLKKWIIARETEFQNFILIGKLCPDTGSRCFSPMDYLPSAWQMSSVLIDLRF